MADGGFDRLSHRPLPAVWMRACSEKIIGWVGEGNAFAHPSAHRVAMFRTGSYLFRKIVQMPPKMITIPIPPAISPTTGAIDIVARW